MNRLDIVQKLLASSLDNERALGVILLESIPDYEELLPAAQVGNGMHGRLRIKHNSSLGTHTTIIRRGGSIYWTNSVYLYKWRGPSNQCLWLSTTTIDV